MLKSRELAKQYNIMPGKSVQKLMRGTCDHIQGAEVTGQLRVNGKIRHLRRCTLEDQSLALKRKPMSINMSTQQPFVYLS